MISPQPCPRGLWIRTETLPFDVHIHAFCTQHDLARHVPVHGDEAAHTRALRPGRTLVPHRIPPRHQALTRHLSRPHWQPRHLSRPHRPPCHLSRQHRPPCHLSCPPLAAPPHVTPPLALISPVHPPPPPGPRSASSAASRSTLDITVVKIARSQRCSSEAKWGTSGTQLISTDNHLNDHTGELKRELEARPCGGGAAATAAAT